MAQTVHLALTANGTAVEGESTVTTLDRENTIECLEFLHGMESRTERGGLPSGKPQSQGIQIQKRIDKSSPLLQKAMGGAETIEGRFEFFRPNPDGDGTEEHFFTVRIDNARVSRIVRRSPDVLEQHLSTLPPYEEVTFIAGEVTWTNENGGQEHTTEFFAKKK